ncbi:MAG: SUMF1/EgtB/PvdO family nonheme iron enzyme [Candidatus Hydrogenedentes bacterium]|nr:SUMF1/EgtB/PvdO family nonheme iron enzyme [Candidatus Hydrogenedentota bacterium]
MFFAIVTSLLFSQGASGGETSDAFVLIRGAMFVSGDKTSRLEDFEILDHPLTNAEYGAFIAATKYQAPLHWKDGRIPDGKEDYPVIFVSRYDFEAYLAWRTQAEGRVYRAPTIDEYEYAARGGKQPITYPWGEASPESEANYDADGTRDYANWSAYLKPARQGSPNGYGLYGMAGNVWQMVDRIEEWGTKNYSYRIARQGELEKTVMGGSWAASALYLKVGIRQGVSSGMRLPDVGFRPVRAPQGVDWRIQRRRLCAASMGENRVFLSWAMLAGDSEATAFNVYRTMYRTDAGTKINPEPIADATCCVDEGLAVGTRYHYYVRSVGADGTEGRRSEWVDITVEQNANPVVASFIPLFPAAPSQGGNMGAFLAADPVFGDLNGDGVTDCVVRLPNGNAERSQDPGIPVQMEAFASYGRSLWRRDLCRHAACFGNSHNVAFVVWDLDQDGRDEVATRLQIGEEVFLAVLDGLSGEILVKTPWPPMVSDFERSSTRIHLSVAYLDGVHPALVAQTGLYENEVFTAYDANLNLLWTFESTAETTGSGSHRIEVADVNGDGKQEVLDGTTCLNADGTMRWSIYKQHPDLVSIRDFIPTHSGLEVLYAIESTLYAGLYMVEADTGRIIWRKNRDDDPRWTHAHYNWVADIWAESPGIECVTNRNGHGDSDLALFSAEGAELLDPFPSGFIPVEWDGDPIREMLAGSGRAVGKFDGKDITLVEGVCPNPLESASTVMVADLSGDMRDELVLIERAPDKPVRVCIVTAITPIHTKQVSPSEDLDYRLWLARNMGGGYASTFPRP